ncbi:trigger factor [Euhalothece natronophila Z-M001]|uniref:Trigger factor n=1 Tax=Euhalothece natronophila Z-M001 TaxID=522448 RepID=A0A5B8NRN7_9CHRO|nr:trigger factor [Euhalothece natronophila]QDZ40969.1 trigger factor [Euhalothece natronophila Z-M001]
MKVTQEKLPDSQVSLEIEVPGDQTKKAYEKVLKELKQSANIPGFRKGKVPRQVLVQRFGKQRLKAAALEELLQPSIDEAVKEANVDALGNYQLISQFEELSQQYNPGEPLTFKASVDVPPEIQLGDYKNLKVQAEEVKADPEKVENYLQEKREEEATLAPVEDRAAQMGDTAIIDYEGRFAESGEAIEGAQATDFELELEEGKFIAGMVEGIVGMNAGETKEIPVTFPEDYAREDLAGQTVNFTVTLKELKAKELPELDDEFAEDVGEHSSLAEWREALSKQYEEQAQEQTKSNIEQAIVQALIEQTEMELPETMIEQELQTIITQTAMQMAQYGIDVRQMMTKEMVEQMKQRSRPDAIARIKQSSILVEISKQEGLEPTPEEISNKAEEVRKQLEDQQQDYEEERLNEYVEEDLRQEKTLEWLREQVEVELVPEGTLQSQEEESEQQAVASEANEANE